MQTLTERLAGGGGPRRRIAVAGGAILVVAIAIAIIVAAGAPGSSKGQSSGSTATGATTVQRRDLVETDTESGTLGYANQQTVYNRLSGTITYLPSVGSVVKPGGTLYQVDGYPVILFSGAYPAYRDLTSGDGNGPDIEELNADLKAMGYDPDNAITVDQTWQDATTDAVERFQGAIGQTETGTISLGQIAFLPGPQLVNAVDTTLGSTGGSSGAGDSSGSGSSDSGSSGASDASDPTSTATPSSYAVPAQPHAELVALTTSSAPATAHAAATTPASSTPASTSTSAACPNDPATTTTTPEATNCPSIATPTATTPTTPTPAATPPPTTVPTTTTNPLSTTPPTGSSGSTLEAIVKLLETQNKLLQAELKSAKSSAGKSSTGSSGSSGVSARSGGGGGGSASSSAASSGSGSSSSGSSASAASGAASADPILGTSSTDLVVTVDLDATKQSEAVLHEPVTVELPDGSTVNGKITAVSPIAQSTSSSSTASTSASAPSATIPVTVSLQKHTDTSALDQAAVSVNFEEQVANNVLSVPVTALLATQGGGYAVQEASVPHKLIPVTPGLFAAGYVQISGPDVQAGMQVTDSQG